jgi:hypothetical protein
MEVLNHSLLFTLHLTLRLKQAWKNYPLVHRQINNLWNTDEYRNNHSLILHIFVIGITWYLGMDMKLSGLEDYVCSTFDTLNQTEYMTNSRKLCLVHLKEPINGVTLQDSTFKTVIIYCKCLVIS